MDNVYKTKIDEANELTEHLPSEIRKEAFSVMLKHLLGSSKDGSNRNIKSISTGQDLKGESEKMIKNQNNSGFNDWQLNVIKSLPESYIIAEKGDREQQTMWAVITLFSRNEKPVTGSVKKIIKDELGVAPQSDENTSHSLKNLIPKYLTREKDGRSYVYYPTRNAPSLFKGLESDG